jgi:hypothetical protein
VNLTGNGNIAFRSLGFPNPDKLLQQETGKVLMTIATKECISDPQDDSYEIQDKSISQIVRV